MTDVAVVLNLLNTSCEWSVCNRSRDWSRHDLEPVITLSQLKRVPTIQDAFGALGGIELHTNACLEREKHTEAGRLLISEHNRSTICLPSKRKYGVRKWLFLGAVQQCGRSKEWIYIGTASAPYSV